MCSRPKSGQRDKRTLILEQLLCNSNKTAGKMNIPGNSNIERTKEKHQAHFVEISKTSIMFVHFNQFQPFPLLFRSNFHSHRSKNILMMVHKFNWSFGGVKQSRCVTQIRPLSRRRRRRYQPLQSSHHLFDCVDENLKWCYFPNQVGETFDICSFYRNCSIGSMGVMNCNIPFKSLTAPISI